MNSAWTGNPVQATGFRLDQLETVFDRIGDPKDWQAPVEDVVDESQRFVAQQHTYAVPDFHASAGIPGRLLVTASGYRPGYADDPSPETIAGPPAPPATVAPGGQS